MIEPVGLVHSEEWTGRDVTIRDIERELTRLRGAAGAADAIPDLRTSVMTALSWAPPEWLPAVRQTLAGLAERHPSRTILLVPEPDAPDGIDADVAVQCFPLPGQKRHVCTEVIELRLGGRRACGPGSIVLPLLVSDLPAFLRWRGEPPFAETQFEQLVDVCDRLIVDSSEWDDVPRALSKLAAVFDRIACSDIAWARTRPWRAAVAELWPAVADVRELRVAGPAGDALLLAGWLRSRLGRELSLVHDPADDVELVVVDGHTVRPRRGERPTSSDLISDELDMFGRDPIYEDAARAA